jgi:hypothetical protein
MASIDVPDEAGPDAVTRLRELLEELERVAPSPRSDPGAERQLALCAEVESILRHRYESRAAGRVA